MNRTKFLKILSLSFFLPTDLIKANSKTTSNVSLAPEYVKLTNKEKKNFNEKDIDDVILKKINNELYYYQPTRIDIRSFDAIGDGQTDDTQAVQKAINSCVKFKKTLYVSRPELSYLCSKKIIIDGQIYMYGDGMSVCGFNFLNSHGFEISEGVRNVIFEKFSINHAIRYSTKLNKSIGINILGSNINRPYTHIYRDLFIDGFGKAFSINWLWDSLFENVKIVFGNIGFNIMGTAVNNTISNSSISVEGKDSKAIFFSDKVNPTEGWRISNILTFGAEIGIHAFYTSNIYITLPILDFCNIRGLKLEDGVGPSANWQVIGGYIAMSKSSDAIIEVNTNIDNNQIRGNKFSEIDILSYNGTKAKNGFIFSGKYNRSKINNVNITNVDKIQ